MAKLSDLYKKWEREGKGLSIFVFVHGWHHNASATDSDVTEFRKFLDDMAAVEKALAEQTNKPKRVVGVFIGWRGESFGFPWLRKLTFWDRKETAERVALGTVRELLARLDHFRDRSRDKSGDRNVRMLTIGHSFGGLITYAATGGEFVRNAVRFKDRRAERPFDRFVSRVGDMVVIVNPAFEGARYEPLHTAGQRMCGVEPNQLPVLVIVTSEGDWATRITFPLARWFDTLLERSIGHEDDAIVKAVGHDDLYTTHTLSICDEADARCAEVCPSPVPASQERVGALSARTIESEYSYMQRFAHSGFTRHDYLCGRLDLQATQHWHPDDNPFWVVRTTKDVIRDHGDIFNPNFVAFVRQLYVSLIFARHYVPEDGIERNTCKMSE